MELSALTLRVLLLFFPGVVSALMVDALTSHRERTPFQSLTLSSVLGIGSYLLLNSLRAVAAFFARVFGVREPLDVTFFDALLDEHVRIAWGEIALSAGVGVMLAGSVAFVMNNKLFHKIARKLQISRKRGDLDVWASVFDSLQTNWIVVRDLPNDFTYYGFVEEFSDTSDRAELLLREVAVFRSSTGAKLYEADRVYFARPSEMLVLEPVMANPTAGGGTNVGAQGGTLRRGPVRERGAQSAPGDAAPGLHAPAARVSVRQGEQRGDAEAGEAVDTNTDRDAGDAES